MFRRDVMMGAAALAAAAPGLARAQAVPEQAFDGQTVKALARKLSAESWKAPDLSVPAPFDAIGYDQWRAIRFDPNAALWRNGAPFQAQFFHRGWLYPRKLELFEVAEGKARPIQYRPEMFIYPPGLEPKGTPELGLSGFRLHAPLNRPDYFDEIAVFLGGSYFRGVGRGLQYGLSARALAINTGNPAGEEFPEFRAAWLERPQPGASTAVVHALIDSRSATAAMRVSIRPGDDTVMDVELTLFPRVDIDQVGIAPGTSMFLFDSTNRNAVDDWRPAVHDSDGLMMLTGRGEQLWRPLANPRTLQISVFQDISPRGFGLMQRKRSLSDFADLEARYEKRPSLWVEPIGDWGEGAVFLVEIPTKQEIHDNIVTFWRPKAPLKARSEHGITYRLHWCATAPVRSDLGRVVFTRGGAIPQGRVFVLEAAGGKLKGLAADAKVEAKVEASAGKLQNVLATPNPEQDGWRLSFELLPGDEKLSELRATLMLGDAPVSETWLYRWTS